MKKIIRSIMIMTVMMIGLATPVFAASGGVEASDTVPAHNLVLRPIISPVGYTISYDLDGGTVATANPTSYNIESGDITLNNPTKEGYEFTGWTGSNGYSPSKSVTIQSGKTGDLSFTANWEFATYSITYDLDGGAVASANPTSYNYFTDTFTLNNPTREGYEFTGWTGSNGSTAQAAVTVVKGSSGNLTYKANWDTIKYYVVFDFAGGKTSPEDGSAMENMVREITYEDYEPNEKKGRYVQCSLNSLMTSSVYGVYSSNGKYALAGYTCSCDDDEKIYTSSSYIYWYDLWKGLTESSNRTVTFTAVYGVQILLQSSTYGTSGWVSPVITYYDALNNMETISNFTGGTIFTYPSSRITIKSPYGSSTKWRKYVENGSPLYQLWKTGESAYFILEDNCFKSASYDNFGAYVLQIDNYASTYSSSTDGKPVTNVIDLKEKNNGFAQKNVEFH